MRSKKLSCLVMAAGALSVLACSASRDVEVSGEVSAPAALAVQSEVFVEFFDLTGDDERTSVHSVRLAGLGSFTETIAVEGDEIAVRAIADADGDGACSPGEAWVEIEAAIAEDDTVEPLALQLRAQPCPGE